FIDEGEQQRQTEDDAQHRQDGEEHLGTDIAIQLSHGPPPTHDGWPTTDSDAPSTTATGRRRGRHRAPTTAPAQRADAPCPARHGRRSAGPDRPYKGRLPAAA